MTTQGGLGAIDAYVSGELDGPSADAFEEAMFSALGSAGTSDAALYLALVEQLRALARRGTFHPVLLPEQAAHLAASSPLKVGLVDADGSNDVEALLASDVVLVRIALPLDGVSRLDVESVGADGERSVYPDVPFDPAAGCIWMACEIELAMESLARGVVQTFVAVEGTTRQSIRELRLEAL